MSDVVLILTAISVGVGLMLGGARGLLGMYRWANRMETALKYVESEMRENGGSTTRDAIKRIEQRLGIEEPS